MTVWRTASPSVRLTDPDDLTPPHDTTFAEAQEAVNIVVFEPTWLPDDCRVTENTLRPEQPPGRPGKVTAETLGQTPWSEGNPCSVRTIVTGEDRRLRLKQFLYDWAPPAASIAPLWGTPEPTPFDCGDAVGWLGTDYKGHRGACVQRDRTQIELSVLKGEFDDAELKTLLDKLSPVVVDRTHSVRGVPFHRLNYWVRHQYRGPSVPHGLWAYAPVRPYDTCQPLSSIALCDTPPVPPLAPPEDSFVLDSAVAFPDDDAIECVFRHRKNASDHLWLTAVDEESRLAPSMPPEPADQPAETRRAITLRGTTVHYAALTEKKGAWEVMWAENGVRYVVWAGASRFLDGDGFKTLVDTLDTP